MRKHQVRNLVFSSSCTVYGAPNPECLPIHETASVGKCHCPYAKCKLMIENMLSDLSKAEPNFWRVVIMRYFNPVGAHPSGLLGEDPKGDPLNLMPKIAQVSWLLGCDVINKSLEQVASGLREVLEIFGDDYSTCDGSAIRDYVHIMDVARAHCIAVDQIDVRSRL